MLSGLYREHQAHAYRVEPGYIITRTYLITDGVNVLVPRSIFLLEIYQLLDLINISAYSPLCNHTSNDFFRLKFSQV